MAERRKVPQTPPTSEPTKPMIDNNVDNVVNIQEPLTEEQTSGIDLHMGPRRAELLEYKRGGRSASEWLEYIYDAPFAGEGFEGMSESEGEWEVDYPDDPDEIPGEEGDELSEHDEGSEHYELSDTNELSNEDAPSSPSSLSPYKTFSASKESSKTKEQSDSTLAFEVAYEHQRRRISSERTLPVTTSRRDSGVAETKPRKGNTTSNTIERSRRGSAPFPEHAGTGKGASGKGAEGTESGAEQLKRNLLGRSLPIPASTASSGDAGVAETENREKALVSSTVECIESSPASGVEHASNGDQGSEEGAEGTESGVEQLRRLTFGSRLSIFDAREDTGAANAELPENAITSSMIEESEGNSTSRLEHASSGDGQSEDAAENTESEIEQPTQIVSGPTLPIRTARVTSAAANAELPEGAIASSTAESSQSSPEHASAELQPNEGNGKRIGSEVPQQHNETAVFKLQQRRLARQLRREQDWAVPDLSKDTNAARVESCTSSPDSSTIKGSQRSPAPVREHAGAEHQKSEKAAGSKIQQGRVGGRLKTQRDQAISITDSEGSSFESRIADTLSSSTATVSEFETWSDRCVASLAEQIESMKRQLERMISNGKDGRLPVRRPRVPWNARFTSDLDFEQVLPCAKRIRFGLWRRRLWKAKPYNISEQTIVTLRHPGRSKRCREIVRGIWEHAQTVNLGQPTQQPTDPLSPQQWPKPAQQLIDPPPWQEFLESMKRPVQQTIEDPIKQTSPQPDKEREQQSINEAAQQLAQLTVQDTITESARTPVEQPLNAPFDESAEDVVQQSTEEAVKPSERSSITTQTANPSETPDKPPAEEPLNKPNPKLLLGEKPEQNQPEEPTKNPSPKSPFRKNPAQRRVERSKRSNEKLGTEATSSSSEAASSSPQVSGDCLAVSGIMVVCDFQPTTSDLSLLPSERGLSSQTPESNEISTIMDPRPSTPPASETAVTTALQSLDLSETIESCPLSSDSSKPDSSP